jgi:hypothetical protein
MLLAPCNDPSNSLPRMMSSSSSAEESEVIEALRLAGIHMLIMFSLQFAIQLTDESDKDFWTVA